MRIVRGGRRAAWLALGVIGACSASGAPASDASDDAPLAAPCRPDARRAANGECVYTVPVRECASGVRREDTRCVFAEPPETCGCADDGNPCSREACVAGECVRTAERDQNGCRLGGPFGKDGLCRAGACCAGCWDGHACVSGADVAACGAGGAACQSCADSTCTVAVCRGWCRFEPINGAGCPACGGAGEPCCAKATCATGLGCESVILGEDRSELRCLSARDAGRAD